MSSAHGSAGLARLTGIPTSVLIVALAAALLHIAPYWRTQAQTPAGWTFTGNISGSPDMMQYRVWMRQAAEHGPVVANVFTSEPNQPHFPVLLPWVLAKAAQLANVSADFVYAYAGCPLAFALVILLWVAVRTFSEYVVETWTVFLMILLGGGLGAHLKILSHLELASRSPLIKYTLVEGTSASLLFEDYRSHYVFNTLFDTHFLLIWLLTTAAVLAFHATLRVSSVGRVLLFACLTLLLTVVHVHEGALLAVIAVAVGLALWRNGLADRATFISIVVCLVCVAACTVWLMRLQSSSGLPPPTWRAQSILASALLLAYPVAWILIAWGGVEYWRRGGFREAFLVGWALGCVALALSGPFYPYPDRGTMTLQIPLSIIAGSIYFSRFRRLTLPAVVVAVFLLGVSPALVLARKWERTRFDPSIPSTPATFLSPEHSAIIDTLRRQATDDDLLLVRKTAVPWHTDDLWLAPAFPGKLYCGHFFLTVDYERKREEVSRFFEGDPEDQAAFLRDRGIRFVYVAAADHPERFTKVPGLASVEETSIGSLFEYQPAAANNRHP